MWQTWTDFCFQVCSETELTEYLLTHTRCSETELTEYLATHTPDESSEKNDADTLCAREALVDGTRKFR